MNTVIAALLLVVSCVLADKGDLTAEASQQKIYDIIRSHEDRKYGDHGGHEYEEGEAAQKQASRKRYGYLPLDAEVKAPVYYDAPKDNIYRENTAAYAPKVAPVHQIPVSHSDHIPAYAPKVAPVHQISIGQSYAPKPAPVHQIPVSHSEHIPAYAPKLAPLHLANAPHQSHYAIVDPITKNHQYVTLDTSKAHLSAYPKSSYILEEEPHYVVPDHKLVAKPVVQHVPKYLPPVKDYSQHHLLDKSHHASGQGHYGDNSVHGESGHKSHKKHDISGHKSHSSSGGHHDEHDHHHNRAHYERDRGYHYEKAYAYDRVRAHHDIGSNKKSHSGYRAHHDSQGHKDQGSHGEHGYSYFQKQDKHGGQGYQDHGLQYLSPHHHAYGK